MKAGMFVPRLETLFFRARNALQTRGTSQDEQRDAPSGNKLPSIYIGALRRSGSTLLTGLLTSLPHSFVFPEPLLARNGFRVHDIAAKMLAPYGIDLRAFQRRWCRFRRPFIMGAFKYELLPQLARHVLQIGVKEVSHEHWRKYLYHFPDMKVLLTVRDPRDIYISVHYRRKKGIALWSSEYTPGAFAQALNKQFRMQVEMSEATNCLKIKYEDLCTNDAVYEQVKSFTCSPIPDTGKAGGYLAGNPRRRDEFDLHGGRRLRQKGPSLEARARRKSPRGGSRDDSFDTGVLQILGIRRIEKTEETRIGGRPGSKANANHYRSGCTT